MKTATRRLAAILRFPLVRIILGGTAVFFFPILVSKLAFKPLLSLAFPAWPGANVLRYLAGMVVSWGFYVLLFKVYERRRVVEVQLAGIGRDAASGFVLGFGSMVLALGIGAVLGVFSVTGVNADFDWVRILAVVAALAFIEELTFRGVVYRIADKWLGTVPALVLSALIFGLPHLANEGANLPSLVSAVLGGIVTALAFTLSGKIWLPTVFHITWNFTQVVFGSRLSGDDSFGSFFRGKLAGPDLLTGGVFGIEASIVTLVVLVGLAAGLYLSARRKGRFTAPFWRRTARE